MSNTEEDKKNPSQDSQWALQQKKTFTAWCNSHLRKINLQIEDIGEDLRSGLKLMKLLEVISGEKLPKPEPDRMRLHKIANVNKALDYIQSKGVKLVSIGAEEIVDGNLKMTLGMIWTIILRFAIQNIEVGEMSAKDALLQWCKDNTKGYRNVKIENFQKSFKDGLAFCALIHNHSPALIDYEKLNKEDPTKNLNLAFTVAEKEFDIPKMLDADELAQSQNPDEKSVMTYVSSYYHTFSDPNTLRRTKRYVEELEEASKRISKAIQDMKNKSLLSLYEQRAKNEISNWIKEKTEWLQKSRVEGTKEEMRKIQAEFDEYIRAEKAEKLRQVAEFEEEYKFLKEKIGSRDELQTVTPNDIARDWIGLESAEKDYEKWLVSERKRLSRVDFLLKKLRKKIKSQEEWSECKIQAMQSEDFKQCSRSSEAKALMKKQEAFDVHMLDNDRRIEQIAEIVRELSDLKYENVKILQLDSDAIREKKKALVKFAEKRRENIQKSIEKLEQLDQLCLIYSSRAAKLNHRLIDEIEDLDDMFWVNNVQETRALIDTNQRAQSRFLDYKNELKEIESVGMKARKLAEENGLNSANVCAFNETEKVRSKLEKVDNLWASRREKLNVELQLLETKEKSMQAFNSKSEFASAWIETQLREIKSVVSSECESLEQTFGKLKTIEAHKDAFRTNIDEIERLSENLEVEKQIKEVREAWQKYLGMAICRSLLKTQNFIQIRDSPTGLDNESLKEFRATFNPSQKYPIIKNESLRKNSLAQSQLKQTPSASETNEHLINAFRILAKNKDYILKSELPPNEAIECIRRMKPYNGPNSPRDAYDYLTFSLE